MSELFSKLSTIIKIYFDGKTTFNCIYAKDLQVLFVSCEVRMEVYCIEYPLLQLLVSLVVTLKRSMSQIVEDPPLLGVFMAKKHKSQFTVSDHGHHLNNILVPNSFFFISLSFFPKILKACTQAKKKRLGRFAATNFS